ncbi:unknown protein [Bathycoccus prasinos]|uniref:Uncharacterized protein n=1 Tax=Bathycoccus prasinos TaxID=41875 RepID=K8FE52_9CHLO|nr:unknown protein [Bathycoccus prasinos]CCO65941.1 unknown protein [Bathycoccus prasinos]|eukprot:XP_007511853.1 unknown protein [Bathycoccus prasinos]
MPTTTRRTSLLQRGALSAAKRFYTRGGSGGATTNKSIVSSSFAKNPDAAEAVPLLLFVSAGVFSGLSFLSRQIVNSPGFYANRTERQRGIDEPEKEKSMRGSNWYNHKVRRYFGERNKRKAPGEVFPTLNAKFAPVSQPYDEILGRKRNG